MEWLLIIALIVFVGRMDTRDKTISIIEKVYLLISKIFKMIIQKIKKFFKKEER